MLENLSLKFPKRVSSATVTSKNLNIFKTLPFLELWAKILYPYNCAGSSEAYLLQLCYILRCPMWGEGKRAGERRFSPVEVYKWF